MLRLSMIRRSIIDIRKRVYTSAYFMFQNSYQNGNYFDLLDPKLNPDKLKPLLKTTSLPANYKVFDKDLKTYVIESLNPNAHLQLPREEKKDLYLIQQFLVLQIYFFSGCNWHIELTFSDLTKTKRRIILTPNTTHLQIKPFFIKEPCRWKEGWNSFVVDLYSYIEAFKGQCYRSLDQIQIGGHFKLRRIYTTSSDPNDGGQPADSIKPVNFLPKQFYLPTDVPYTNSSNRYEGDISEQIPSEMGEHSTKNSSFLKSSKAQSSLAARSSHQPPLRNRKCTIEKQVSKEQQLSHKTEQFKSEQLIKHESIDKNKLSPKKRKDFLSNTNGNILPKKDKLTLDQNASSQKVNLPKQNSKHASNPWRTPKEKMQVSDHSQLAVSKHETGFTHKGKTAENQKFGFKKAKLKVESELSEGPQNRLEGGFSDSDYVQLSHKFSTFTQERFLKKEQSSHLQKEEVRQFEDEIQQNIQVETNSLQSSAIKKIEQKEEYKPNKMVEFLKESVGDSLDLIEKPERNKMEQLGNSSLYGFGENLMRNFMHEVQRPYSPPIGDRQVSEQQSLQKDQKEEVELIYDPVLNCYYDYRTHTYYQLKN